MTTATPADSTRLAKRFPVGMLLCGAAIVFNLVLLLPGFSSTLPLLNDGALHLVVLRKTVEAIGTGQDLTDLWIQTNLLGYPLFHHYQHLAYVLPALIYWPFRSLLPLPLYFQGMITLLLSLFPLTLYRGMRLMGFDDRAAGLGALVTPLVSSSTLFGLEYGSYTWAGHGLYTQLWGMFFMPLAIGRSYRLLDEGKGLLLAALLAAAVVLFSLPIGYVTLGSICLIGVILPFNRDDDLSFQRRLARGAARLVLLLAAIFSLTAYFMIPFLRDSAYMNRSVWYQWENDSAGFIGIVTALLKGDLFDYDGFPALSILVLAGVLVAINRWEKRPLRTALLLFAAWLMLAFGRQTWGALYDLLPMGRDMQLGRLITGIHFWGILLIGAGLGGIWEALAKSRRRWLLPAAGISALGLIITAAAGRVSYITAERAWMDQTRTAYDAERGDIEALVAAIEALPPGRVYAGKTTNWGGEYRVGWVPMNAILTTAGLDTAGYSFHSWPLVVDIQLLMDDDYQPHYDLLAIRYLVMPADMAAPPFASEIGRFGRHALYQVETTGFFDTGTSLLAFSGSKYDFFDPVSAWFMSALTATGEYPAVYLGDTPVNALPLADGVHVLEQWQAEAQDPVGRIISEEINTDTYRAGADFERDGILILKVNYHPGLRATADGEEADLFMVMPGFTGLRLGEGEHDVVVSYQPDSLRPIWLIGGAVIAFILTILHKKFIYRMFTFVNSGTRIIE